MLTTLAPPLPNTLYLANPSTEPIRDAMRAGIGLGAITTPAQGNILPANTWWAADNGVFGKGYPGDREYLRWLENHPGDRDLCLFATAPDVVGDAWRTLARSRPFFQPIRDLGYPVALVLQNGEEYTADDYWDEIDAVFIGGDTPWKLGEHAAEMAAVAKSIGKWVHMGRVNSLRRLRYAESIGCDSADGTVLKHDPKRDVAGWVEAVQLNPTLWRAA